MAIIKCYNEAVIGVGMDLSPEEEIRRIQAKWGASHVEELAELVKDKPEQLDKGVRIYGGNFLETPLLIASVSFQAVLNAYNSGQGI